MSLKGARILVLEDEQPLGRRLESALTLWGMEVTVAQNLADSRRLLRNLQFEYALLDLNLPDGSSLELLDENAVPKHVVTVFMRNTGNGEGTIEALRFGPHDYVMKPVDPEDLRSRLLQARRSRNERRKTAHKVACERLQDEAFFFGETLSEVRQQIERIHYADRLLKDGIPSPILIDGEPGSGKTMLSRRIHGLGPRSGGPLLAVSCREFVDTKLEPELFGQERGAFSEGAGERISLFEAAEGGSLLIDDLDALPLPAQAKLVAVLEISAVRRLGGNRLIPINARVIATTSADLSEAVRAGRFLPELLHRLDLYRLRLPSLRERGRDVVPLAHLLLAKVASRHGFRTCEIPAVGLERLLSYRWPGNVRELIHEIERSLILDGTPLSFEALGRALGDPSAGDGWWNPAFAFPEEGFNLHDALHHIVGKALEQAAGDVSVAARLLGVAPEVLLPSARAGRHAPSESELFRSSGLKAG